MVIDMSNRLEELLEQIRDRIGEQADKTDSLYSAIGYITDELKTLNEHISYTNHWLEIIANK